MAHGADLERILHSWKSHTAHKIGHGVIWQREYFDRIVRDSQDFWSTRNYVLNNPFKAGLKNWKWMGASTSRLG
jgi:hypothetical protein